MERSGILNNSCMTRECLCDLIIPPLPLYRVTFYNLEESSSGPVWLLSGYDVF